MDPYQLGDRARQTARAGPEIREARTDADEDVKAALGADNLLQAASLTNGIANAKAGIPSASPLWKLIELEGQRWAENQTASVG